MLKIRPLGDRAIVKQSKAVEKIGMIHVPDSAQEKNAEGEVLAVGPGRTLDSGEIVPVPVKAGDKVLYSKYGGQVIKLDGEEYLVIKSDDIHGILD